MASRKGNDMKGFAVTFERYLPHDDGEDICEPDEIGFVIENVSLRDAMRLGLEYSRPEHAGTCEADCYPVCGVRWLSFSDWNRGTHENLVDGVSEARALHIPDGVSEASRMRICRLFGVRV
jgi:hypothetical protein